MAQVNLLHWRETEQQRTKQRFYRHIAAVIGVTTAVILVAYFSISALQQQQILNTIQKVPLLGDIPYVGVLFRNESRIHEKRELLILVTPRIVNAVP